MADDTKPPRRHQTATERDMSGMRARRDREQSPIPIEIPPEITGNYEGEELVQMRARRPTDKRLERLEEFKDAATSDIGEIKVTVAEMRGELKVLPDLFDLVKDMADKAGQRETVKFTAEVDVGKAQAIDVVDAGKARREWIGKMLTIAAGLVGLATAAFAAGRC